MNGVGNPLSGGAAPSTTTSTTSAATRADGDSSIEGFGDVVGDLLGDEVGNGFSDLLGLQLSDLFGVLLGDEVSELPSLLPGEEEDVAVGVGFCGDNGLSGGGKEGGAVFVVEDGLRRAFACVGGEEFA